LKESTIESTILSNAPTRLKQFESQKGTLLYRGSRDGFRSSAFHLKCDGQSNTVTVILTTKDFIIGGFTPIAWDSSNSWKTNNSQHSFVFSVHNATNSDLRSFPLVNSSYTFCSNSSYGPTFGNGCDIYVANG
jgi:hypothetical protein